MSEADQAQDITSRIEAALYQEEAPVEAPEIPQEVVEQEVPQEAETPKEDNGPVYQTVEELAQALEVSPEDFATQTKVKVKVFDDEREVSLADLQAGYQKGEAFDEKKAGLSKEKADFAEQRAAALDEVQKQAEHNQAMAGMYKQVLLTEFSQIDWQKMQRDDPIEFAEKYPAYQQKYAQLEQVEKDAESYVQQVRQERLNALIPVEKPKMLNMIPEWRDPDVFDQGKREVTELLQEYKLSDEIVVGAIHNAGAIKLLHDFIELKKSVQRTSEPKEEKTVTQTTTNILKPGPRKSQSEKQRSRVDQLRSRLKKTGSRKDLNALLAERM